MLYMKSYYRLLAFFISLLLAPALFAGEIQIDKALLSPDGSAIVIKDNQGALHIYNAAGKLQSTITSLKTGNPEEDDAPWALEVKVDELHAVSPQANFMLVYSFFDGVQLINRKGVIQASLEKPPSGSGSIDKALFSLSGERILLLGVSPGDNGNEASYVALYDLTGKLVQFIFLPGSPFRDSRADLEINEKKGVIIVHPPFSSTLHVISYQPQIELQTLSIPGNRPEKVTLSPGGTHIAWLGVDRHLYYSAIRNLNTKKSISLGSDTFFPENIQFVSEQHSGLLSACDGYQGFLWRIKKSKKAGSVFSNHADKNLLLQCSLSRKGSPTGLILFFGNNQLSLYQGSGKLLFSIKLVGDEPQKSGQTPEKKPDSFIEK